MIWNSEYEKVWSRTHNVPVIFRKNFMSNLCISAVMRFYPVRTKIISHSFIICNTIALAIREYVVSLLWKWLFNTFQSRKIDSDRETCSVSNRCFFVGTRRASLMSIVIGGFHSLGGTILQIPKFWAVPRILQGVSVTNAINCCGKKANNLPCYIF